VRVLLRATSTATRASVFKVISERPVILTSECRALGEGAITTDFNVFGLSRLARAGLELTTSRLLSESTTTRLRQPVNVEEAGNKYKNKPSNNCSALIKLLW
jgi:hypothetical protein